MTRPADAVRTAVRGTLKSLPIGSLAAVACSGGPDSVALAAASADVAGAAGVSCGAVVVDHGLQTDSGAVAAAAALTCEDLGLAPVLTLRVAVASADGDGPEAAARKARYQGIEEACDRLGIGAVLLGHTLDDQAETVLLGLSRGSGTRSLAGMPKVRGRYHRPLLGLPRAVVRSAYPDLGGHQDAHNQDPRFLRARVRHELMPALVSVLGPGVPAALARSAELFRADADAVQAWADQLSAQHVRISEDGLTVEVGGLSTVPTAVLARVLRDAAVAAGADAGRLTSVHVSALVALIDRWHGQGPVDLPGAVTAVRSSGRVVLARRLPT